MKKYIYRATPNEDLSKPNNNYWEETNEIITDGIYDFEDWLRDNIYDNYSVEYDESRDTYYILDGCNERTGGAYKIVSVEEV